MKKALSSSLKLDKIAPSNDNLASGEKVQTECVR